jgi:drug/metabolite transporter (DMT)-like permease
MVSMLIWAASLPAADLIIPLLLPEQLNALRMSLAALSLLPVWALVEGWRPLTQVSWLKGVAVGALIGIGAWFLVMGQARSGPVTVAVISATMPVVGIALEVVLDGRKMTRALTFGLMLTVIGGFLALDFRSGGLTLGLGALFCFGSVLTFTLGSRLTVTAFPDQSPLGRTTVTLTGAAIAAMAVALLQWALGTPAPSFAAWGLPEVGAILLFSVGALGVSQVLWIMAIGRIGIGLTALHMNTTPFYVMLILFALGGVWNWPQAGAAALVALGVLIAQGILPLPFRLRP